MGRRLFDGYMFADYSGARDPGSQRKHIVLAVGGQEAAGNTLVSGVTREGLLQVVLGRLRAATVGGERLVFGFDHNYSFPVGFAETYFRRWPSSWRELLEWYGADVMGGIGLVDEEAEWLEVRQGRREERPDSREERQGDGFGRKEWQEVGLDRRQERQGEGLVGGQGRREERLDSREERQGDGFGRKEWQEVGVDRRLTRKGDGLVGMQERQEERPDCRQERQGDGGWIVGGEHSGSGDSSLKHIAHWKPRVWAEEVNERIREQLGIEAGPFWGPLFHRRPNASMYKEYKLPNGSSYNFCERRLVEERCRRMKTIYQLGGIGSVGQQSLYGMLYLRELLRLCREEGVQVHVWPQDGERVPEDHHLLVEVYPTLCLEQGSGPRTDAGDAAACVQWVREQDQSGQLGELHLRLEGFSEEERERVRLEGWVLGV